jgi:hypothetical protein
MLGKCCATELHPSPENGFNGSIKQLENWPWFENPFAVLFLTKTFL